MNTSVIEIRVPKAENVAITEDTLTVDRQRWANPISASDVVSQTGTGES